MKRLYLLLAAVAALAATLSMAFACQSLSYQPKMRK